MYHSAMHRFSGALVGDEATTVSANVAFAINGRFFGQAVTGVQRYARQVVDEIDALLGQQHKRAHLIVPSGTGVPPRFTSIETRNTSGASGHLWEQVVLPLKADVPLLNLCNTAPLALRRQIVCMHDTNVFDAPESYSLSFRAAYRTLLPGLARRGVTITSVSRFSAERLAWHIGIDPDSVEVMYNGHEHVFLWNAEASSLGQRLPALRPFVLLLGSQARHKNAAFILQQARAFDAQGIDLVVAGGSAQIFSRIATIDAPNIHYLGFVTDDDLAWLYARALCLAFPSRSEGFGLPLVEAMALGCPIIASNQSCMPEICGDAALLEDPDDATAWQDRVRNLAGSSALRADLRARGLKRVRLYSWRASAQGYMDLLARL